MDVSLVLLARSLMEVNVNNVLLERFLLEPERLLVKIVLVVINLAPMDKLVFLAGMVNTLNLEALVNLVHRICIPLDQDRVNVLLVDQDLNRMVLRMDVLLV